MPNVPLHPALVHLPIGLALLAPAIAVGIGLAVCRGKLPRRAWWMAVAVQAAVLLGGFAASQAGERDEERIGRHVPKELIHEHEERAELFLWAAGAALAAVAAAGWISAARPRSAVALAAVPALAAAALALYTGEAGGELVYRHGAADAWVPGRTALDARAAREDGGRASAER